MAPLQGPSTPSAFPKPHGFSPPHTCMYSRTQIKPTCLTPDSSRTELRLTAWPLATAPLGAAPEGTPHLARSGLQGLGLSAAERESSVKKSRPRACQFSPPGPACPAGGGWRTPANPTLLSQSLGQAAACGLRPGHQQLPITQGFCGGGRIQLCSLSARLGGRRPPRPAPDPFYPRLPEPRSGMVLVILEAT